MSSSPNPPQLPAHIYGLHDLGGQDRIASADRTGWLLDSVDLSSPSAVDYSTMAPAGFGILVRLNHSAGDA
jgi:hypothetical protein